MSEVQESKTVEQFGFEEGQAIGEIKRVLSFLNKPTREKVLQWFRNSYKEPSVPGN